MEIEDMKGKNDNIKELAMDYAEFVVLLISNIAKSVINRLGKKEGEKVLKAGLREFGLERGRIIRSKVDAAGLKPTLENFLRYYKYPTMAATELEQTTGDKERTLLIKHCPFGDFWEQRGEEEIGLLYCDMVDTAIREGFDLALKHSNPKNLLRGDVVCEHREVFK
ncbi:MAG: L-2-amino-thiazoline-4-carboxylic acid hydrolase [Bacteroidia bacterium]|jgi:hypothetical protein|nr:L-2-amino-thiazoline-4-carboxylic acid hydrolase [Bacteroidia bacterium]